MKQKTEKMIDVQKYISFILNGIVGNIPVESFKQRSRENKGQGQQMAVRRAFSVGG